MDKYLLHSLLFYVFGFAAVAGALGAVLGQRILRAVVCLMLTLGATAAFYVMLGAEFVAGIQILVYVGGIIVLLVFAIMLTQGTEDQEELPATSRRLLAFLVSSAFFLCSSSIFMSSRFANLGLISPHDEETKKIGRLLLDGGAQGYLLPFELISLLLLAVIIGGITIARKPTAQSSLASLEKKHAA